MISAGGARAYLRLPTQSDVTIKLKGGMNDKKENAGL